MAWGKNRRSSAASGGPRPSSSGGRGGRRPPGEPTEQDIARSIQQSAVRVRVTLQLADVQDETKALRDVLTAFEQQYEARRGVGVTQSHHVRVELLECGLNSWQNLVELQRVLAGLKRPTAYKEEQQLTAKTILRHDSKYDEWMLSLGFTRASEDELWRFASSLMLRLKSSGVLSKVLLSTNRMMVRLASAFVKCGNSDIDNYHWKGKQVWSQLVVDVSGEEREQIQRVFLPPIRDVAKDPFAQLRYPQLTPIVDDILSSNADSAKPVVVILRGIPGSGKSTLGREMEAICRHRGAAFTACSADFFFETPRGYVFDVRKLGAAHSKCKGEFTRAVQGGIPQDHDGYRYRQHVVLVDNTSTQRWEYEPYEDIARSYGSRFHIVEMKCVDALMAFRMGQRNSHGVPPDKVVVSMFMRWEEDRRAHCFTPQFEHARVTGNPLSDAQVGGLTYLGLFLDDDAQQKMLSQAPLAHSTKLADHVTLFYRPNTQYARLAELGAPFTVYAVEVVQDDQAQTLRVEIDERLPLQARNKIPHITLSTRDGVSASYSNDLLESKSAKRKALDPPIELTTRVGAALFVQNQRVITTSSPFGVDTSGCFKDDGKMDTSHNKEELPDREASATTRVFVLYVNESDVLPDAGEDTAKLLWRAQIMHHMGSRCSVRRLLCIQRPDVSTSASIATILRSIQDRFLIPSSLYFDDVIMLPQPPSFPGFEKAINEYVAAAGVGRINQLTLLTSVEQSVQWRICEVRSLREASLNVVTLQTISALSPVCLTISSALDLLSYNIQEDVRSAVFGGMSAVTDAWSRVVGTEDRQAVQRIDTTIPGLSSRVVELCLMLPSDVTSDETEVLMTKLLSALEDTRNVHRVVRSCSPDQFYFTMCTLSSYTPEFCVRMARRQEERTNPVVNTAAQLKLCEQLLKLSREACDVEAYSVLVALLRAVLLGRCSDDLPSKCRLSTLVNLTSERLVLHYVDSIKEARPTADDVTSGRIITAVYNMLTNLSKLEPVEWAAAFGDALLALQGNEAAQTTWRTAVQTVMQSCVAVLASHRCVSDASENATLLYPSDHLRVVVALMKTDVTGTDRETPTRTYVEVSGRSAWSPLHSLACCDKLRSAAAMVLPQDDDEHDGDRSEFFSCAPSLVTRRVDVTTSSLDLLRTVLEKLHALDSEGALSGAFVIRRAETDEEVATDLKWSS
ncbi:Fungal tRNA ligase phosphodiesterase domain [Phytophthora infestans]|uniref:Fungal tRNA ligase phosphodiesterase domain n=1 Tax=Phytophthora infestans TaxID=4787 RepID=A0A833SCR2_PHYIN|nr:Fungal tRNA ligase phosphodiesterase domain [Phytophthora infestans]